MDFTMKTMKAIKRGLARQTEGWAWWPGLRPGEQAQPFMVFMVLMVNGGPSW